MSGGVVLVTACVAVLELLVLCRTWLGLLLYPRTTPAALVELIQDGLSFFGMEEVPRVGLMLFAHR